MANMNTVDYKVIKSNIIKACKQVGDSNKFEINYQKLKDLVEDINLVPVEIGMKSEKVDPAQIPFISEYFEKSKLSWFSENKYITTICFLDTTAVDEKAVGLLEQISLPQTEVPDADKVKAYATLVAEYPCYFAVIVSYMSNSPVREGKPSYIIQCRANKVVIKSSNYQYNHKDFS